MITKLNLPQLDFNQGLETLKRRAPRAKGQVS